MTQIQNPNQFTKAAERLQRERMGVRRYEVHMYEVTNKTKGTRYRVRLTRTDAGLSIGCDCPADTRHHRAPLTCKHVAAVVIFSSAGFGRCAAGSREGKWAPAE
jgi:hypothetical protein